MKNNNTTELVFIIDRSGSMQGLEKDTIGGFNSMLEKQKREGGRCFVSTVLFDSTVEVLHDRVDLQKVCPITEKDYFVRGCTALMDAVGGAIDHIGTIHKYARKSDVPAHTLFVIITDGMENASSIYSRQKVKEMIEHQKRRFGWEFVFIGANIDAAETAEGFGIEREFAVDYHADGEGPRMVYEAVSCAAANVRANAAIGNEWRKKADIDFENRK